MKKLILFLFLFFCAQVVFAENVTITVVSDVHLSSDKQNNKMTPSIQKLLNFTEQTNRYNQNCVVFLGDNLKSANKIDLVMFSKIISKLNNPVYVTVGNNDLNRTKGLTHKEYYRVLNKFSPNKIKSLPAYKKIGDDMVFVFLSGANETFAISNGYYKPGELEFLDKTLTKFKNKKAVIFQHFPVVPPVSGDLKQTHKAEEYLDILAKHDNVLAVISGHYNKEAVIEENGIKHISVSGFGQTGGYEQVKIFRNKNGTYSITAKVLSVD